MKPLDRISNSLSSPKGLSCWELVVVVVDLYMGGERPSKRQVKEINHDFGLALDVLNPARQRLGQSGWYRLRTAVPIQD